MEGTSRQFSDIDREDIKNRFKKELDDTIELINNKLFILLDGEYEEALAVFKEIGECVNEVQKLSAIIHEL